VPAILDVQGVGKVYEPPPWWLRPMVRAAVQAPVRALADVSLTVERGQVVGLVGPNGAGKTTLLKIVATTLMPTEGTATVDGFDVRDRSAQLRDRLGLVLEGDQGLYSRLTGRQNLELYGRLAGLSPAAATAKATEMLELLELAHRDKLVFGYSAGMKMRLSIGRALVGDPALVILDEPTRSLDPVASRFAIGLFRRLADEGRAVLFSNHRLDEVTRIADQVVAIVHGRAVFSGTPAELGTSALESADALAALLEREAGSAA
jgi:ABC-2 type transport system ATP-binding protein